MNKKIIGLLLLAIGIGSVWAQALPPGNYMDSCGYFSWNSTEFIGYCQTSSGQLNGSGVDNANLCAYVENINGQLTCTGGYKFKTGACASVENINGVIKCYGYQPNAGLCPISDIENNYGVLTCNE
jgi:hypothetical protein